MPRFAGMKSRVSPLCEVLCLAYIDDFRKNEQPPLNREAAAFVTSCANAIDLSAQGAVIYLFLLRRSMTMNTAHATASTPTTTSKAMIAACHQARL